ncbi:hypothetical protein KST12_07080 [Fusobacterium polymorphum]|uniref:hypothetical protein n=1 Tax=Fusobacterium nucleatum subsp. polymorphum TaxID=76857 RepID=UPI000A817EF1|nr:MULTISPECIES: hypothetical protein [Fusobacterium]MCG6838423.1 hypothetical protein [Fusobacterium nucleatum]
MNKYEMVEIMDSREIIAKEFNRCKEDLKLFFEEAEKELDFTPVNYTSCFGLFTHTVTGAEFNKLTSEIQKHLMEFHDTNIRIIKEFQAIYNTFNALDNEYIKNIMQSIMKSNEAINKANLGLIEAEKRIEDIKNTNGRIEVAQNNIKVIQDELEYAQKDLDKHMEIQKKIVDGLTQFKGKIDSYKHLKDIDNMWENLEKLVNKIPTISGEINNIKIDIQKNVNELNNIKRFKDRLENYKHLEDIDKIWNNLEYLRVIKSKLETIENIENFRNDIEGLKKLNSNIELRLRNTFNFIEQQKKKIEDLETSLQASQDENISLSKKLNMSYLLGGGALILGIFNIFYLFLRG